MRELGAERDRSLGVGVSRPVEDLGRGEPDREDVLRALLDRTRNGEAFAEIYRMYVRLVHYYLHRRLGPSHDLEAIANETFLQAYKSLHAYEHRSEAEWRGWLTTLARRVSSWWWPASHATVSIDLAEDLPSDGPNPEDAIYRADLERAIGHLTAEQQQVVRMRFFERRSHAEIGLQLDREPDAIRALQYRAVVRLRGLLAESSP